MKKSSFSTKKTGLTTLVLPKQCNEVQNKNKNTWLIFVERQFTDLKNVKKGYMK
jgi:hypothetical protein